MFHIFFVAFTRVAVTELDFYPLSVPAVAVIKASELWDAMEPELLVTVRTALEPTSEEEKEQQEDEDDRGVEEEKAAEDDRATAVKIAQYMRVNKYR